jgi:hypothetical protein
MARSNTEFVRDALELHRREGFDALVRLADPEVEVRMGPGVNAGEYRGIDDVIRFNSDWEDAWADTAYDLAEIEELDDHNVVARIEMRLRGEGSGVEVTATAWWLFEVRDERFLRWHLYSDRESALAAAAER